MLEFRKFGRPPTGIIGFGMSRTRFPSLVPSPPQKMNACEMAISGAVRTSGPLFSEHRYAANAREVANVTAQVQF